MLNDVIFYEYSDNMYPYFTMSNFEFVQSEIFSFGANHNTIVVIRMVAFGKLSQHLLETIRDLTPNPNSGTCLGSP